MLDDVRKYSALYLARSRRNTGLEGDRPVPCCVVILQVPNLEAVTAGMTRPKPGGCENPPKRREVANHYDRGPAGSEIGGNDSLAYTAGAS